MDEPLAGVLERQAAALGELLDDPLDAEREIRVNAQLRPWTTARLVMSPRLQRIAAGRRASPARSRPRPAPHPSPGAPRSSSAAARGAASSWPPSARIIPNAERSMPTARRPAALIASSSGVSMSRRAATTTTSIWRSPFGPVTMSDDLPVEHRLLERHRDVVGGLEADRGLELLGVVDRRHPDRPHGDALVGDPEPDRAAELLAREQLLERGASASGIGDLALAEDAGREGLDPVAGDLDRPLARTSVAAMLSASISSPTTVFVFLICLRSMDPASGS